MQLSHFYLPLLCLIGFASQAAGQVAAIEAAFLAIADALDTFGSVFALGTSGTDILAAGDDLLDSIDAAIPIVQGSPNLNIFQAIGLADSLSSVGDSAEASFNTVVAQRPVADTLGITADVQALLIDARSSVATLGAAVVSKVPSLLRGEVRDAVADVDARIANAIVVYS